MQITNGQRGCSPYRQRNINSDDILALNTVLRFANMDQAAQALRNVSAAGTVFTRA